MTCNEMVFVVHFSAESSTDNVLLNKEKLRSKPHAKIIVQKYSCSICLCDTLIHLKYY